MRKRWRELEEQGFYGAVDQRVAIDNLSLMAMTVATGFVVDDAIVVIENITRYLEEGMTPMEAAFKGAEEIGFTVMSISISLVAVFIPILLLGGQVGRLFREFSITLSIAIGVSMIVSLTATPMMCAHLLRDRRNVKHNFMYRFIEYLLNLTHKFYERSLGFVLRHPLSTLLMTFGMIALTVVLCIYVPKGFFPQQDTGRLNVRIVADQDASSDRTAALLNQYEEAVREDPAVSDVLGFSPSGTTNTATMFVTLKDEKERKATIDQVRERLNRKLAPIPGGQFQAQAVQDLKFGGRSSGLQYQYALQGETFDDLYTWAPKLMEKMRTFATIAQVATDQQDRGLQSMVVVDRQAATRLQVSIQAIDTGLYDAFGQAQVSTMYTALNQYHVVMEVDPAFSRDPAALDHIYVPGGDGESGAAEPPFRNFMSWQSRTACRFAHQSQFPSVTLSFNLEAGAHRWGTRSRRFRPPSNRWGCRNRFTEDPFRARHGCVSGIDGDVAAVLLAAAESPRVYIVLGMLCTKASFIRSRFLSTRCPLFAGVGAILA